MRILITGGGGFIGAWLARRLAETGNRLRVFEPVPRSAQFDRIVGAASASVEWHLGDIADGLAVRAAAEGCDAVVHLAGILTPACKDDPVRGAMINLVGTLNVFNAARALGIRRIVFTSSAGVYGPDDETTPRPVTHYGTFKLACEGSARAFWADHGIASVGFRPYIVYGYGRESGSTAGPSLACRAAARGEAYVIPYIATAGLVFVDDVVAAYEAALRREPHGAHVFNLPGEVASNDAVVAAVRAVVPNARIAIDGPLLPFAADIGEGELRRVFPDLPATSLRDGIRRTIELYRADR
ncbi:SDR family oxidoreductase [Bradyrhizobium sp. INPA01-394B]|uniref:SDR family oxidoreductase n=1 Tax=Bradyrhizobium campsiandrae TaxID=1729892 RepID=A0ABR7UKK4_9BRAD|nr:SDR family oxidoreductase [Bradyrhizobium campsiandrae]MBC9882688.1 SDR family oxidoreductase [Bradyrhizobium campsiandrae]MBC9984623.1 SDR family oxidoreductase [Bradyrhizobium campsiandrae]